jgi:hypothetical protein
MFRLSLLFFLSVSVLFFSCKLDSGNECYFTAPAYPTAIDDPNTAVVNQPVIFNMTFQLANGCGSFSDTETFDDGDTTEVIIRAKYQGCVCTQQIVTSQHVYSYTPTRTGAHYFKYFISEGNYLRDTIWVQ